MEGPNTGVPLKEALRRTGYSYGQMRVLRVKGKLRWQKRGMQVYIHPEDVDAMEKAGWQGRPFVVTPEGKSTRMEEERRAREASGQPKAG